MEIVAIEIAQPFLKNYDYRKFGQVDQKLKEIELVSQ